MIENRAFGLAILAVATVLVAMAPDSNDATSSAPGIPPGAIIGWLPPEEGAGIPPGWMVCSRANQIRHRWVPDLTTGGRFLRAAEEPFPASDAFDGGQDGGSPRHSHSTARRSVDQRRVERRSSGDRVATETHLHTTDAVSHLPPHVRVIFLCKCRSSDCSSG